MNENHNSVITSIKLLPDQISQTISEVNRLKFPEIYHTCNLITIAGMGGSIYSYYVLNSLFSNQLIKPLTAVNNYSLPQYCQWDCLFMPSSYSGMTEETIIASQKALSRDIKTVIAVTTGGKLAELMTQNKRISYCFEPKFNPSGQPRLGLGYMIFAPIITLSRLGYLKLDLDQIQPALLVLKKQDDVLEKKAREISSQIKNKIILLVGAEHLFGNMHIFRNQLNETSKNLSQYHEIPELNHHLMEGLQYPQNSNLSFIFFNSFLYSKTNLQRFNVTKEILNKQNISFVDVQLEAANRFEEFLLILQLNSYVSYYLSQENHVDPIKIPWVDYFKLQISKNMV